MLLSVAAFAWILVTQVLPSTGTAPSDFDAGAPEQATAALAHARDGAGDRGAHQAPARQQVHAPGTGRAFHGRCVAAESGEPLAEVQVQGEWTWWQNGRHHVELTASADPQGWICIPHPKGTEALDNLSLTAWAWRADRAPIEFRWMRWHHPEPSDTRDPSSTRVLQFPQGAVLHGRVMDATGMPVSGVRLELSSPDLAIQPNAPDAWTHTHHEEMSAPDGTVHTRFPVAFGSWRIQFDAKGLVQTGPPYLEFGLEHASQELRFVLAPAPTISGRVLDPHGRPLEGVLLEAFSAEPLQSFEATSGSDGSFSIAADRPASSSVMLFCDGEGLELVTPQPSVAWGTAGLELIARARGGGSIRVQAQRTGSQQPIEFIAYARKGPDLEHARSEDGIAVIDGLEAGSYDVFVEPQESGLQCGVELSVLVAEGVLRDVTVPLARLQPFAVLVSDEAGAPVEGATVWLAMTGVPDGIRMPRSMQDEIPVVGWACMLDARSTDERGFVELKGHPPQGEATLVAVHDDYVPTAVVTRWDHRGPDQIRVVLRRGGRIAARVEDLEPEWSCRVRVTRVAATDGHAAHPDEIAHLEDDQRFNSGPLPEGSWNLALQLLLPSSLEMTGPAEWWTLARASGRAEVRSGATTEVTLDASSYRSSRFRGWLTYGGARLPRGELQAHLQPEREGDSPVWFCSAEVRASGAFEFPPLPPGKWRFVLRHEPQRSQIVETELDEELDLIGGSAVEQRFDIRLRLLRLRLRTPSGTPAAGVDVISDCGLSTRTNASGEATLGPFARRLALFWIAGAKPIHEIEFPHGGGELFREVILK